MSEKNDTWGYKYDPYKIVIIILLIVLIYVTSDVRNEITELIDIFSSHRNTMYR